MSTNILNQFWSSQQSMLENNMKETNPLEIHDVIVAGGVAVTVKEDELILVVEGHVFQVLLIIKTCQFWRC